MKILIAEDDPVSVKILQITLEHYGHQVVVADSGETAWQIFDAEPVRVIVSDWMMPGIDGCPGPEPSAPMMPGPDGLLSAHRWRSPEPRAPAPRDGASLGPPTRLKNLRFGVPGTGKRPEIRHRPQGPT